jgi:hypothetical protein
MSDGTLNFPKRNTAPTIPSAGRSKIYVDAQGKPKIANDDGTISGFESNFGANYFYNANEVPATNNTSGFQSFLTLTFSGLDTSPTARYRVAVSFAWNYSAAQRNYIGQFSINNVPFGEDFSQEPKDVGGDNRIWESLFVVLSGADLNAAGFIGFNFRAQNNGDVATTYFARLELFRVA